MKFYMAPLQGYTDFIFRKALISCNANFNKYFTPYVKLDNNGKIKQTYIRDLDIENNDTKNIIPQVLCNTKEELSFWTLYCSERNYKEININLGCPYPMVANRKKGSGLLKYPEILNQMVKVIEEFPNISYSVKMRLGYESDDEWKKIIEILNDYSLSEIIIHPRIGKQLYKGEINQFQLLELVNSTKHKLIYNGDIFSKNDFDYYQSIIPNLKGIMLGRACLTNPLITTLFSNNELILLRIKISPSAS